jgi:hypothetical protein
MAKAKEKDEVKEPTPAPARICHEHDRSVDGLKRFKVRATNHADLAGHTAKYVLAPSADAARVCYLKAVGLDQLDPDAEPVNLFLKELPD